VSNRQVDLANIQPDMAEPLKQKGLVVIKDERGWNKKLMINHKKAPYSDRRFRHALAFAINQQEIIDKSHRGFAMPASYGLLSPDHDMYNSNTPSYAFSPEKARALVQSMGYEKGADGYYQKAGQTLKIELLSSNITVAGQSVADRDGEVIRKQLEQVAEPLIQHSGANKAEAELKARERLERLGIPASQAGRFLHEVSGGEIQRALLAMALIMDPEALILDEPTAGHDVMTKSFVSRIILNARDQGKAVLLITHDFDLAKNMADDLVMLYLGQVMETLPAGDLLMNPLHPYTLALGRSYPSLEIDRDLGGIRGDAFYRVIHRHAEKNGTLRPHSHVVGAGASHADGHSPPKGCLFQPRCTQALPECAEKAVDLMEAGTHQVRCLRGGIATQLELEQVSKRYGVIAALGPTSLTLRAGGQVAEDSAGPGGSNTKACPFAARCDRTQERCTVVFPEQLKLQEGQHRVWCHFPIRT
jgi:ABC-type dipeptide/oligopeptide/nickel transport system ATPase component